MAKARTHDDNLRIHQGATVSELALMFGGSQNDVLKKIGGRVEPVTPPGIKPMRYRIREAAPYLVEHNLDAATIEQIIRKMPPDKLPPKLSDTFWKGQNARLDYQKKQGELWSTERVVKVFSDAFKPCSITIKMFADTVAQTTNITPEQKAILQELSDGLLSGLQSALVDAFDGFGEYTPASDEHGMPISEAEGDEVLTVRIDAPEGDGFDDAEEDDGF